MNEELRDWLKERTQSWYTPPQQHCLSDKYQLWDSEALFPGVPAFLQQPPARKRDPNWPSANPDDTLDFDGEGWREAYRERDVKRTQLVRETHNEFAELLSQEEAHERREQYATLLSQEKSMRERAQKLATEIDKRFEVEDPSSGGRSTLLDQTLNILRATKAEIDKHGSEATLRAALDTYSVDREWRIEAPMSSPLGVAVSSPQHDAYDLLSPLSEPKERPCISIRGQGFNCGFEWLPADATLKQVSKILELHFEGVEQEADRLCRTHALLSYRLQALQALLREYELYGEVDQWRFIDPLEVEKWIDREIDDSDRAIQNLYLLLRSVEETLSDPTKREEVWGGRGKHPVNFSGLHGELKSMDGNPLQKENGDLITQQWLGDLIKEFLSPEGLEVLWREAHGKTGGQQ